MKKGASKSSLRVPSATALIQGPGFLPLLRPLPGQLWRGLHSHIWKEPQVGQGLRAGCVSQMSESPLVP